MGVSLQSKSRRYALAVYRVVGLPLILLAAIALPFTTRDTPLLQTVENTIHDRYRYAVAPESEYEADIALLLYDDAVARGAKSTSPVDRALLGEALLTAEGAGAKAIGIDMIFVQPTDDEDALVEAINALTIPIYIAYADPELDRATYWDASIDYEARDYQDQFWARIAAPNVHKVTPVVGIDQAGIARRWPDLPEAANPPLSAAMAGAVEQASEYKGAIAFPRAPAPPPEEIEGEDEEFGEQIEQATGMLPSFALDVIVDELFADFLLELDGRLVLVGADTFNADQLATPITRVAGEPRVPGVTVHAQMLRQALDRNFPRALPIWGTALLALLFVGAGVVTARIERKPILLLGAIATQAAGAAALPLVLHNMGVDILSLPLFGLSLGWLIAFLAMGYALRTRSSTERAFARGTLGKYLPENVAKEILDHPDKLELQGEERPLFLMFTDLQGFTSFSHGRPARDTADILNRYLEEMSRVVLDHRGTIDKFVGDAVVAFWGAPLVNPQDGENAVRCAMALYEASEKLREDIAKEYGDTLGRTRIGLHYGPVVVGNFGGKRRIQYTALGDAMNIAARLEGANKYTGSDILVSRAVADMVPGFTYRPLGRIQMSGVATGIEVLEPVRDERTGYTQAISDAMQALDAGEAGAADTLRELGRTHPEDRALEALIERADVIAGGKPYVLGSK